MSEDANKANRSIKQRIRSTVKARRKRRMPCGFQFLIADSIDLVPKESWDQVVTSATCFLSREYLHALEVSAPSELSLRYAMVFDQGRPIAALATQLVEINGKKLMSLPQASDESSKAGVLQVKRFLKSFGTSAKRKAISKVKGRLLVCGNLFSWGQHGIATVPDYSAAAVWPAIAEALYRIRRSERLSGQTDIVMIKDFTSADENGIEELKDFRYAALDTDPNMVLAIPESWKSFDDYLSSLASKYRSSAKKIAKDIEGQGITLEQLSEVDKHAESIHQLYLQVHSKAAVRPVTINSGYIPAVASALGDRFRCTVARQGEKIVGFITTIKDGDTCVGYLIGFDYGVNQTAPLYFRLLQVCVEDSISYRCARLSLGRTALDPKARLGARPEPMRAWLRHRHTILNWVVQGLLGAVPHDEAPDRSPFKNG